MKDVVSNRSRTWGKLGKFGVSGGADKGVFLDFSVPSALCKVGPEKLETYVLKSLNCQLVRNLSEKERHSVGLGRGKMEDEVKVFK